MSLLNIFPKSVISEDINDDINRMKIQMADINVRKSRAMKVFDDQINVLQKQLLQKQKMSGNQAQQPNQPNQNMQQPAPQI
jgi:hypothetical protein